MMLYVNIYKNNIIIGGFLMHKLLIAILLTVFSFSTTVTAFAKTSEEPVAESISEKDYSMTDILSLEKYIQVKEGLFVFDIQKALEDGKDYNLVLGQQKYLEYLNQQVKDNVLKLSKDLTIENIKENDFSQRNMTGVLAKASCKGKSVAAKYYWWGYKTVLNSCETKKAISDANTVAAAGGIGGTSLGGLGIFFPVLLIPGAISGATGSWFYLFATRLDANNKGKGVIVEMTWAAVFDITPQ